MGWNRAGRKSREPKTPGRKISSLGPPWPHALSVLSGLSTNATSFTASPTRRAGRPDADAGGPALVGPTSQWSIDGPCLVRATIVALGIVTTLTTNYGVKQNQFTKPTSEPPR